MKTKTPLVHGAWLLVAITSFAVGAKFFPAGSSREDARPGSEVRGIGPHGKRGGSVDGSGGTGAAGRSGVRGSRVGAGIEGATPLVLSEDEITKLGEKFRDSSSPIERRLAFSRLLEGLTAENALQVREQIAHMDHRSAEFREFHYAWGAVAGTEAVMFGADTKEDDMNPALAGWASANPNAALAWYKGLDIENDSRFDNITKDRKIPAEALRFGLMRGLVQGLADADPHTATQFIQDLAASGQKGAEGMIHIVADAVLRTDSPAEAAAWSESLAAGPLRGEAMAKVAHHFARQDIEAAATWATNLGDQPEGARVIGEVAYSWASRDPEAAVTWVNRLPAGHSQDVAMHRALNEWAGKDPTAAGEHILAMPASQLRDSAISGYSKRVAWEDPRAAMGWAETISSFEERTEAIVSVARAWRRKDAPGAAEWVNSSELSPEAQQAIINPQKREWNWKKD